MTDFAGVSAALLGLLALLLIVGAGVLVGATLRVEGPAALVLTVYVVGYAEVVALSLFLSLSEALTRVALIAGVMILAGIAVAVWVLTGMRRLPRIDLRPLRGLIAAPQ